MTLTFARPGFCPASDTFVAVAGCMVAFAEFLARSGVISISVVLLIGECQGIGICLRFASLSGHGDSTLFLACRVHTNLTIEQPLT